MARSRREPRGLVPPILDPDRAARAAPVHSGRDDPALRECLRRLRHRLRPDRRHVADRDDPDRGADPRGRAPQSWSRICHGDGHGRDHGDLAGGLFLAAKGLRKVVAMNVARLRKIPFWSWFWFLLGALYFILPLYATLEFSLEMQRDKISLLAYEKAFADSDFIETFTYSNLLAIATIIACVILIVPTAYWIRLRVPEARRIVEFITLMPFVIPAIILVFGLIRIYSSPLRIPTTDITLMQPL